MIGISIFILILAGIIYLRNTNTVIIYIQPVDPVQQYWDGPVPTKAQEKATKEEIFRHIERFPNGIISQRHPEYVDEYLSQIDLDLPEGITKSNS
jgi:hypothetical protein